MSGPMVVTQKLFELFLAGCGGRHVFLSHEELLDKNLLEAGVQRAEREYGFSAWQKNVGIITTPAECEDVARFRAMARSVGYRAYINHEEARFGSGMIEFCEIILLRFDVADPALR